MRKSPTRREILIQLGVLGSAASCAGCGTLMYPERIGQTRGKIDWRIAALNGAGLLLFFVPGVIAFAVDFYNGTIFLPPEHRNFYDPAEPELLSVKIPTNKLDRERIEMVVSKHAGKPVALLENKIHTEEMSDLKNFWPTVKSLHPGADKAS